MRNEVKGKTNGVQGRFLAPPNLYLSHAPSRPAFP
jgi:hypothetical protein